MSDSNRRTFLQKTVAGLASVGVAGLVLRSDATPTQQVTRDETDRVVIQMGPAPKQPVTAEALKKVTPQPYGPFYRHGAPFRGKAESAR